MTLSQLLNASTSWLAWAGLVLAVLTIISFVFKWGTKFRLVGATTFTFLLSGSCFAFSASYTPPLVVEGAKFVPVVYDNGNDLLVAQAPKDFPSESIQPTLEQLAGNIKKGSRTGETVKIRLRKVQSVKEGVSAPLVLGEVVRDLRKDVTISSTEQLYENNEEQLIN